MPKERILPYIILGLVSSNSPITGRGISQHFNNEIGNFWKASHSQIYPELKRMVSDNWLQQTTSDDNAKEKYYHLTELGSHILSQWLLEPVQEAPIQRDLFSLKMFFIDDPLDNRIETLLEEELNILSEQLALFKERQKLIFPTQAAIHNSYGHYLILDRAIARVSSQIDWLEETLSKRASNHHNS